MDQSNNNPGGAQQPAGGAPGAPPAAAQQGGGWNFAEMCKMMMIFMLAQNVIQFLFKGNQASTPVLDPSKNNASVLIGGRIISEAHLQNYLRPGDAFDVDVYVNYQDSWQFFNRGGISAKQPVWAESRLTYDYAPENDRHINLTLPASEAITKTNKTLNLHMQVRFRNPFYTGARDSSFLNEETKEIMTQRGPLFVPEHLTFNATLPLLKYMPKRKQEVKRNLLTDDIPMPEPKKDKTEEGEEDDGKFHAYFKKELYLYVIYDPTTYGLGESANAPPPQIRKFMTVDLDTNHYFPAIYLSDYWCLKKDMPHVNETVRELNLSLHFNTYSLNYFIIQKQFEEQHSVQKQYGLDSGGGDMDEMKRMFLETDPVLLTVTMVVSLLHTVFEMLAFKNDINFWKTKDSMEGISVRTLYTQTICSVIIFFYLLDNETSFMILFSSGFAILLDFWKIKKASKVKRVEQFPYFSLEDNQNYVESETREYDRIAMRYMSWAMVPLMIGYTVYSVMYNEHKGWYSFVLNTLVGSIYTFGFIQMTPQLYINYRLKSVEHMPSKALFYRFLNTIIDDLFSFIITMPTLHRLSCFRDDVIFLIYLYQRYIYKVDKTRGPYGNAEDAAAKTAPKEAIEGKEKTE